MPGLDRRRFLLGTGAVLLAACGGGDDDDPTVEGGSEATTSTEAPEVSLVLGFAFNPNTFLLAGVPQRASAVLFDASGGFATLDAAPAQIDLVARSLESGSQVEATVARHGDDLDRPYYPAALTFPVPGTWEITADLGDGTTLQREVQVNSSVGFPQVGDALPPVATPTVDAPLDAATICTRTPACPFHEVSLDEAMAGGRPVAVLISTPAYCQVAICGPVLDLLIDAAGEGDLAIVHIEAFPNGSGTQPGPPSPILTEDFGLDFEPVLYVAGANGLITARLDSIYDGAELAAALASAG